MNRRYFTNHMNVHRVIMILLCLLCAVSTWSQKLTVESFGIAQRDLSARTHERVDANKMPCGLVKVQLAAAGATFDETGFVIGNVERRGSEYWVYMSQGSYLLQVDCPGFLPLKINLRDHGLKDGIQAKVTYSLVILKPAGYPESQDDGMRFVALSVEPKMNAIVYIDEKLQNLQNGAANILLPMGQHTYRVEAQGYESQSGTFRLGDEKLPMNIQLRSSLATLSVSCPTTGSELFINDERRGTMPWQGQLPAGTYRVEARLSGYRPQRQSVTLQQRGNETVTLLALSAIAGQLSVNYLPQNAEVWLDGKQLGTTPDIFRGIIIGTHDVEIRKSGYETKRERVTIAEGQTASLSGTLLAASSQNTASNTYTNGASSSSSFSTGIEAITVNGVTFNMVRVEGGTFQMGSNDSEVESVEKPVHQVTLSSYSIGETEVTQALWEAVMGSNPSYNKGSTLPVDPNCHFLEELNHFSLL